MHEFDFDDVTILINESFYMRRLVSEILNRSKQPNGINLQTDTNYLGEAYLPILNKFKYYYRSVHCQY
jgi:hypothetical protein